MCAELFRTSIPRNRSGRIRRNGSGRTHADVLRSVYLDARGAAAVNVSAWPFASMPVTTTLIPVGLTGLIPAVVQKKTGPHAVPPAGMVNCDPVGVPPQVGEKTDVIG